MPTPASLQAGLRLRCDPTEHAKKKVAALQRAQALRDNRLHGNEEISYRPTKNTPVESNINKISQNQETSIKETLEPVSYKSSKSITENQTTYKNLVVTTENRLIKTRPSRPENNYHPKNPGGLGEPQNSHNVAIQSLSLLKSKMKSRRMSQSAPATTDVQSDRRRDKGRYNEEQYQDPARQNIRLPTAPTRRPAGNVQNDDEFPTRRPAGNVQNNNELPIRRPAGNVQNDHELPIRRPPEGGVFQKDDALPIRRPTGNVQNDDSRFQDSEGLYQADVPTVECPDCGRKFNDISFPKHVVPLVHMILKSMRLAGTEADKLLKEQKAKAATTGRKGKGKPTEDNRPIPAAKKADWKSQSNLLREAMKANRTIAQALKEGKDLKDIPPPPSFKDPSLIPCPTCGRSFNELAAERHIPRCQEQAKKNSFKVGPGKKENAGKFGGQANVDVKSRTLPRKK